MIRNLVLRGGPGHDFDATTAEVIGLLDAVGVESIVVDEPDEAFAALASAAAGSHPPIDLFTVLALRWQMRASKYDADRVQWAYTLAPRDGAVVESFVRAGGGLLALHTAVICFDADPNWHAVCGGSWNWDRSSHPPLGPTRVEVTAAGRHHPITAAITDFDVVDEVYLDLDFVDDVEPLLVASVDGEPRAVCWARTLGAGRVVTDLLGHDAASLRHATHREVLTRAVGWVCALPEFSGVPS